MRLSTWFILVALSTTALSSGNLSDRQIFTSAGIVEGYDLTKSFKDLDMHFEGAEAHFKSAEECFKTPKRGSDDAFVEFPVGPKTSETYSFISIPDLEGKDHVYVVQVDPLLGNGKAGKVRLAKDIKNPNEFVAIKETSTRSQNEIKGLKPVGELLGSVAKADKRFLVMPFVPGIQLYDLATITYKGRLVCEYWNDKNNEGYRTLLYRIARDIVAPLVNKNFIHTDLLSINMMVAKTDENHVPTATDPATGLQHFRAIDFGDGIIIPDGRNILNDIGWVAGLIMDSLLKDHASCPFDLGLGDRKQQIEKFEKDVIDALDKDKFVVKSEGERLVSVIKNKAAVISSPGELTANVDGVGHTST